MNTNIHIYKNTIMPMLYDFACWNFAYKLCIYWTKGAMHEQESASSFSHPIPTPNNKKNCSVFRCYIYKIGTAPKKKKILSLM